MGHWRNTGHRSELATHHTLQHSSASCRNNNATARSNVGSLTMVRAAVVAAVVAALLAVSPALAVLGDNGMTTYDGRPMAPNTLVFGRGMALDKAVDSALTLTRDVLTGTFQPMRNEPATEKQEIAIECLNSVAPPPLNWKMWCPGTDAKVMGWTDKSGALHRSITLRPQAGMTAAQHLWFIAASVMGLMPPVVEFNGSHFWYYHLWHPLDHVESSWALGPVVPIMQRGPPVYVHIHERYRNPASFPYDRHYETNGCFFAQDVIANLLKGRFVIEMPLMGMPTWQMLIDFKDTPEGLVVDAEIVAGVPPVGYDKRNPRAGFRLAAGLNELFTAPILARDRGSVDFEESINAITRHVIEEFSNLQHFVPYLYDKYAGLARAGINWLPSLERWMQHNGIGTKAHPVDAASISFYHTLSEFARRQVDLSGTPYAAVVDAGVRAANGTYRAAAGTLASTVGRLGRTTYAPLANAATKALYQANLARG